MRRINKGRKDKKSIGKKKNKMRAKRPKKEKEPKSK